MMQSLSHVHIVYNTLDTKREEFKVQNIKYWEVKIPVARTKYCPAYGKEVLVTDTHVYYEWYDNDCDYDGTSYSGVRAVQRELLPLMLPFEWTRIEERQLTGNMHIPQWLRQAGCIPIFSSSFNVSRAKKRRQRKLRLKLALAMKF